MLAVRLRPPRCSLLPVRRLLSNALSRPLGTESEGNGKHRRTTQKPKSPDLSLLEELFPEESRSNVSSKVLAGGSSSFARLPLPEVEESVEGSRNDTDRSGPRPTEVTELASRQAFRLRNLAVLVLQVGSKSLVESDFRRIAPKGQHIDDWTGPGDILKVIPARDPVTLEQAEHYFIVFPNPAYARAYQDHVMRLYRTARALTPTSIESPFLSQKDSGIDGRESSACLQDFALCSPSQRIRLKAVFSPFSIGLKRVLDRGGYLRQPDGGDRTGRAVLFSVDGLQPTTREIGQAFAADGRDRGMMWNLAIEKLDTAATSEVESEDPEATGTTERTPSTSRHRAFRRWILSFGSEDEARRFVRAWHRKQFPSPQRDDESVVRAEILW